MAKYTELYSEYLAGGGSTPLAFELIPSIQIGVENETPVLRTFNDLFTEKFACREIGFETETLFSLKLDLTASVLCPQYAQKIAKLAGVDLFTYQSEETAEKENDAVTDKRKIYNDGLENQTNEFADGALSGGEENDLGERYEKTTITKKGISTEKIIDAFTFLQNDVKNLYDELLQKFDKLFMQVL